MDQSQLLPESSILSVFIQAAFDTGIIIDTSSFNIQEYREYAAQTISILRQSYPEAKWMEEDVSAIHGSDDAIDFLPVLNLSYVMAVCPKLLTQDTLNIETAGGAVCTVTFRIPVVYFHSFSAGIISIEAQLDWSQPYTLSDLRVVNDNLLTELAPLVETRLAELISIFSKAVNASKTLLYDPPFTDLMPSALNRNILYWSHFVYVIRNETTADLQASANWLNPLMMTMDQRPVENMAIKPDRYIYLGWGRSMICCLKTFNAKSIHSYVRILEIRNYLWKTLYDLDRGLRNAILRIRNVHTEREASRLEEALRVLDFKVKGVLEELDSYKMTFDHEKIWLIKQLDTNWLTQDLITSLESRLQSFCDFFDYANETMRREQEKRVQRVLNLLGVIATAGAIVTIIAYFDPSNHLALAQRFEFLFGSNVFVALMFFLAIVAFRKRQN